MLIFFLFFFLTSCSCSPCYPDHLLSSSSSCGCIISLTYPASSIQYHPFSILHNSSQRCSSLSRLSNCYLAPSRPWKLLSSYVSVGQLPSSSSSSLFSSSSSFLCHVQVVLATLFIFLISSLHYPLLCIICLLFMYSAALLVVLLSSLPLLLLLCHSSVVLVTLFIFSSSSVSPVSSSVAMFIFLVPLLFPLLIFLALPCLLVSSQSFHSSAFLQPAPHSAGREEQHAVGGHGWV